MVQLFTDTSDQANEEGQIFVNTTADTLRVYSGATSSWYAGVSPKTVQRITWLKLNLPNSLSLSRAYRPVASTAVSGWADGGFYLRNTATIRRMVCYLDSDGADGTSFTVYLRTFDTSGTRVTKHSEAFTTASPTTTFTGIGATAPIRVYESDVSGASTMNSGQCAIIEISTSASGWGSANEMWVDVYLEMTL
jgi:hypothetical protein